MLLFLQEAAVAGADEGTMTVEEKLLADAERLAASIQVRTVAHLTAEMAELLCSMSCSSLQPQVAAFLCLLGAVIVAALQDAQLLG
jgi:hypothetical protein